MRAKTVGFLVAGAVALVTAGVWSATRPTVRAPVGGGDAAFFAAPTQREPGAKPKYDGSRFELGQELLLEGRLGHARMFVEQDNETYLYLQVKATEDAAASEPSPLNVAIVIDRSGSMRGKRLSNAIAAARGMIERLREGDTVTVITYNTRTEVLVPTTTVDGYSRERVATRLEGITAVGDTCISCAIDTAVEVVGQRSNMVNRILLLSDGEATAGVRDVEGFRRIAAGVQAVGSSISSVGVDVDYNERIMTTLAQESNGRHYFVAEPSGLAKVFDRELESLVATVAKSVEVHIDFAPGVEPLELYDRAHRTDGNRLIVPLGSFSAGDTKTVLARVYVNQGPVGERAIVDVRLSSDREERVGDAPTGKLLAWMTPDRSRVSELDALVSGRVSRSDTSATLREANRLFAAGKTKAANEKLEQARSRVRAKSKDASPAAPASRRTEVEEDFAWQVAALDDAHKGFAERAARAAKSAPRPMATNATREGRAQVRANAYDAFAAGL